MSRRRPRAAALVLALLGAAATTAPGLGSPAAASCAGPSLDVDLGPRPVVAAGDPLVVRGEAYLDECDDGGGCTAGCSGCPAVEVHGLRDVTLEVRQGRAVLRTDAGGRLVVRVAEVDGP